MNAPRANRAAQLPGAPAASGPAQPPEPLLTWPPAPEVLEKMTASEYITAQAAYDAQQAALAPPPPPPAAPGPEVPKLLKADDVDPAKIDKPVLTSGGWIVPLVSAEDRARMAVEDARRKA